MVERPAAEQHIQRRAPQRAEQSHPGHATPEALKRAEGALGPAYGMTIGQHRPVHGAGRGAGDAVDPQPWLLEQPIQHAPGERAMRAAALQRQIHQNRIACHAGLEVASPAACLSERRAVEPRPPSDGAGAGRRMRMAEGRGSTPGRLLNGC